MVVVYRIKYQQSETLNWMSTNTIFIWKILCVNLILKSLSQHKIGTMFPGIADAYRSGIGKNEVIA